MICQHRYKMKDFESKVERQKYLYTWCKGLIQIIKTFNTVVLDKYGSAWAFVAYDCGNVNDKQHGRKDSG